MDRDNTVKRKTNPRVTANIFTLVTFLYTLKTYIKGFTKGLEINDVYDVLPDAHSGKLCQKLDHYWEKEKKTKDSPSICRAVFFCFGRTFLLVGIIQFVAETFNTIWSPEALSKLISYFNPGQTNLTKEDAIYYACLVIGINLTMSIVRSNFDIILAALSLKARAAIASLLYRKSLKVSSESLSDVTAGKIVTILSKDTDILETFFSSGNGIWIAMIQTCVICYLIYQKIGLASFAGITFFLVVFPLQVYIGTLTYSYKLKCSQKTDERLNLIREVLSAIKIIKMYTWEKFFEDKISDARKKELRKLHKLFYTRVWISIIGNLASKTAFFLFVMTYVWTGQNVSAETVYYILSCFNDLQGSLSDQIPFGFSQFAQLFAIATRIESVMKAPELPTKKTITDSKQAKVCFNDVDVTIHDTKVLENISLDISDGLNVVVGHTGSGKTTLLKTILGECQTTGKIDVCGKISYASQEPWLFPSTIKNNILFGEEFNQNRYHQILEICSLDYDLDLLPEGENTVVGESGINLSKGQQARINLARALYRKSDIYLLDDCLASLDGNVSDSVFQKSICEFLEDKIRIFVTSSTDYAQRADKVIVVNSKCVKFGDDVDKTQVSYRFDNIDGSARLNSTETHEEDSLEKQIYHEEKKSGVVPLNDYLTYVKHGGGPILFTLIVSLFVLSQYATSYSDKLLSTWITLEQNLTNLKELNETDNLEYGNLYIERQHELGLYTTMVLTSILFVVIRSFSSFHFVRMASISIHKAMVRNIMNSTMKFFDTFFIGNVLNRFTKDFVTVDETLPFVAMNCFTLIFTVSGGIILLTTVNYIFLIESLFFLVAACLIKQFCQPTGRNLERLHMISRSPLTGHLNSTLEGLITIRSSNAQEIVTNEFDRHQDLFTSALFMVISNFAGLAIFLEYISIVFTSLIIFQLLLTDTGSSIGDVGLAITQAFSITGIITSGITSIADCENLMVSVERVLEFTKLEEEDKSGKNLSSWPKLGSISFNDVALTYNDTKMLRNINFDVNAKEKVGIIGRTGAGKSSIITSLFRIYQTQGKIAIDEVDINHVSLKWLRSNISLIPQDPYLFPGSIRENLDPMEQYSDEEIWKVLKELHLDAVIKELGTRIDKGTTFSTGQKQLLCFARAILRKNKIVILDEVTANVDKETEVLIEEIVQKQFKECTMLIVAHKSLAVLNCTKIMVLSSGRISEFDEPNKLFQNEKSFIHYIN
ncbi:probable multidrug resistance-associated protein lethal(2)03659 [Zophobas morio]|uniref:probable multidrug resistance-associated protein lethal(2)03659 n=1 Tax=Zophobas morio TaxID=2755281 RepID=UPI0030834B86